MDRRKVGSMLRTTFIPEPGDKQRSYLQATCVAGICTLVNALLFRYVVPANLILVYLCGIVLSARLGRGPSILAAILSMIAFGLFFASPSFTLTTNDLQYLLTFALILTVVLMVSSLTRTIKEQAQGALQPERITATLFDLSDAFATTAGTKAVIDTASQFLYDVLKVKALVFLPGKNKRLIVQPTGDSGPPLTSHEIGIAQWVYEYRHQAGLGTDTLPGAAGLYLLLATPHSAIGVLGIYPIRPDVFLLSEQKQILSVLSRQIALAIERSYVAQETEQIKLDAELDRLRNALLRSIAHDLRTPLTSVTGSVSTLLDHEAILSDGDKRELAQIAYEEANRLNRLIGNLLDMTRIETGAIHLRKEWLTLEEVISATLARFEPKATAHPISLKLASDLPFIRFDEVLIAQVFINLVQNAIQYTPPATRLYISAFLNNSKVTVEVADDGPGLMPGDETHVFDKFYRAHPETGDGIGLGLTICRAIIEAHGGRMWAENRPKKGAAFYFTLPLDSQLPDLDDADEPSYEIFET